MQNPTSQTPNRFAGLPTEVIWEILLKTSPKDIANYCLTSKEANGICKDPSFWRTKLWVDFGKQKQEEGLKWKEMYQMLLAGEDDSPISAGKRNYTYYDKAGNLYMAGRDATYIEPNGGTIKISKALTKIPMASKVISVSQRGSCIGAITEDDMIYIWTTSMIPPLSAMTSAHTIPSREVPLSDVTTLTPTTPPRELTFMTYNIRDMTAEIKLENSFDVTKLGKPVKIVILSDNTSRHTNEGYAIIMSNGTVFLTTGFYDDVILTPDKTYGNFVDIMGSFGVYALTTSGIVVKVDVKEDVNDGRTYDISKIALPEPIMKLSAGNGSHTVLSKSGNVYIWGDIADKIDETMSLYTKVTMIDDKFPVYKVNLPRPISFIYISGSKLMAVSIYGKLYVLEKDDMSKLTEIRIGNRIKYVADGDSLTVIITTDGVINYWNRK